MNSDFTEICLLYTSYIQETQSSSWSVGQGIKPDLLNYLSFLLQDVIPELLDTVFRAPPVVLQSDRSRLVCYSFSVLCCLNLSSPLKESFLRSMPHSPHEFRIMPCVLWKNRFDDFVLEDLLCDIPVSYTHLDVYKRQVC